MVSRDPVLHYRRSGVGNGYKDSLGTLGKGYNNRLDPCGLRVQWKEKLSVNILRNRETTVP